MSRNILYRFIFLVILASTMWVLICFNKSLYNNRKGGRENFIGLGDQKATG